MSQTSKRKRTYNQYMREENPFEHIPRTTRWRRMNEIQRRHQLDLEEEAGERSEPNVKPNVCDGLPPLEVDPETCQSASYKLGGASCQESLHPEDIDDTPSDDTPINTSFFECPQNLLQGHVMPDSWVEGATAGFQSHEQVPAADESESGYLDPREEDAEWYDCQEYTDADHESSHYDEKLYEGAPITLAESMTLILLFIILKHSLSGACLEDLLVLLSLHCVKPNLCKTSRYLFQKYFSRLKTNVVFHKFCSVCQALVTGDCCTNCQVELNESNTEHFIEIPIQEQLQTMFLREGFIGDLHSRFHRNKQNNENMEDIYDGREYLSFSEPGGILAHKYNLSFFWYTDGIPLFKSSKTSLWPLYFMINELPYHKRVMKDNMIFAGLWFGTSKPCMSTFLKPFHAKLTEIHKGVPISLPTTHETVTVRGVVLGGTCDLPAKAIILNMTQFNGKSGCARCKQEGKVIRSGRGHTRVYPFRKEDPTGPQQTHSETLRHAEIAFESKRECHGVKGPSWFFYLGGDIIRGTGIDYMHQVLLGLVRKLLKLWFTSSYSSEMFSLSKFTDLVDRRLADIKPPNFISRLPRSIHEHMKFWKASECRSWLFYYSVPLLMGVMEEEYLDHYLLLVEAIFLLIGTSISVRTVDHCEYLLQKYVCLFSVLYGEIHMSANLHLLLHLPDAVRDLGPLLVQSCFHFEGINGQLLNFFNGTQKPEIQITSTIGSMLITPSLVAKLKSDSAVAFYDSHLSKKPLAQKRELIAENVWLVGAPSGRLQVNQGVDWGLFLQGSGESGLVYSRLQVVSTLYQSRSYKLVKKRNSFSVAYKCPSSGSRKFGQIEYFVKITSPEVYCFAVIRKFEQSPLQITSNPIFHLVKPFEGVFKSETVCIDNLIEMCVFIQSTTDPLEAIMIIPPNVHEKD